MLSKEKKKPRPAPGQEVIVNRHRKSKRKEPKRASATFSIGASLVPESTRPLTPPSDLVPENNSLTPKTESRPSASVLFFQLQTEEERGCLSKLKLQWGNGSAQQEFDELVLAHLAVIADTKNAKGKNDPTTRKKSESARRLRRRARRVRQLIGHLQKPFVPEVLFLPPAPIPEMLLYAESLDLCADHLRPFGDSFLVDRPPGVSGPNKRQRRRKTTPETEHILKLVELVKRHTGQGHYNELLVLLKSATGDQGYNKHRLQSLCSLYRRRSVAAHRQFLRFCRSLGNRQQ